MRSVRRTLGRGPRPSRQPLQVRHRRLRRHRPRIDPRSMPGLLGIVQGVGQRGAETMKVQLTQEQRVLIKGLAHHQIFGHSEEEVVRSLLDYAIRQMVETEYVQKTMAMRVAALG